MKTRLSNSYLIGEIFGMLFFGILVDRLGRKTGIVSATFFLVLGIILATASHGTSELGYVRWPRFQFGQVLNMVFVLNTGCFG